MQADASWGMMLPPPQPAQPAMDQPVAQSQQPQPVEKAPETIKEKFQGYGSDKTDISDPNQVGDWLPIIASILLVLATLVFSFRYMEFWGKSVNNWYNTFGLSAVMLDLGFVGLVFTIGRWLYTKYIRPRMNGEWSTPAFMGTLVGVQVAHHFLFNHLVLRMFPVGENAMLDLMRAYANNEPFKALTGHSTTLVAGSALVAAALKAAPACIQVGAGLLGIYAIPYVLTTREKY